MLYSSTLRAANTYFVVLQMYHIEKNRNRDAVKEILKSVKVPVFEPRSGVKIAENDSQLAMNGSGHLDADSLEPLKKELSDLRSKLSGLIVRSIKKNSFEYLSI